MSVIETEVVSVIRQIEPISRKHIHIVTFAVAVPLEDDIFNKLPESEKQRQEGEIYTQGLVLSFLFDRAVSPYKVGTKWNLNVDEDGSIKVTEVK